jgi:uncharacterized membrane protein
MSAAHVHLALNHVPVLGTLFGAALLAYGLWRRQEAVQRASLGLLAVAGIVVVAVYWTGEPAEEIVEGLAGVSHDAIEVHEEWGWYAFLSSIATGIAALASLGLGRVRRQLVRRAVPFVLALSLISTGVMLYTASLGGKISHPELRGQAANVESVEPHAENE